VATDDETARGHDPVGAAARSRRRWRAAAALVAGCIVVASLLPPAVVFGPGPPTEPPGPLGLVGADKWLHAVGYAAFAGTVVPGVAGDGDASPVRALLFAVGVATGLGLGVELLQWPHPGRTASLVDAAANLVGAAVGAGVAVVGRRRHRVAGES
jgi:VanZ family protein